MNAVRYALLACLALAPALAVAQPTYDIVVRVAGTDYSGLGLYWVEGLPPFVYPNDIGPLPLVIVESGPTGDFPGSPPDEGCNPYTPESAAEVEGNIAFVERGVCSFVTKIQNASAAGAVAVLTYQDERGGAPCKDGIFSPYSDPCGPAEGCTAPTAFLCRDEGLAILKQIALGEPGTIIPQAPPPPPASVVIDNGMLLNSLFADGFIGTDPSFGFGEGFTFEGTNGLFVGSLLIGVAGDVNTNPYDGESEFTEVENALRLLDASEIPAPFDAGATSQFTSPLGFTVTLTGYADADTPNEDFVVYVAQVQNTSGADIKDVHLGIFADWDAGASSGDDAAGYDEATNLVYVFDPVEAFPYFGVAAVGDPGFLSGYSTDATMGTDAQLFDALTTEIEPSDEPMERAAVTGVGPFDIASGATEFVRFAFVAGEDLADLLVNAAAAQFPIATFTEATPEGTFALGAAYPNPASARATLSFTLPSAQAVRLAVYDVLGREVAVLVDGARPAGEQGVAFDAAALPSGVYLVRLEAGEAVLTQRLTLVR